MFDQPTDFLAFQDPELKLSALMEQYRDEHALMGEMRAISWSGLARQFARAGYRDDFGMAPTAETADALWRAVQSRRRVRPEPLSRAEQDDTAPDPVGFFRLAA